MIKKHSGMTLLELLSVISIISILFILLIPAINYAIEKSRISGVQTDFHSYEVAARGYLMEVGEDEKTEDGLNKFLDKNLKSNSGESTEKGPWGKPYKIKIDNENKQFIFTTSDKENKVHKIIVSWGDEVGEIKVSHLDPFKEKEIIELNELNTLCESRTIEETDPKYFSVRNVSGGVMIVGYSTEGPKNVVIPCKINGMNVVSIGASGSTGAFINKGIESVILPNTLKNINGMRAFYGNNLKNILIPSGVSEIGESAFEKNQIEKLILPSTLSKIDNYAFRENQLTELVMNDNLSSIGGYSFSENKIKKITFSKILTSIPVGAFQNNNIESLDIPGKIFQINTYAFRNNSIKNINFHTGTLYIFDYAFENNLIENLILPDGLSTLGQSAFYNNKISSLIIPNSLYAISMYAFHSNNLKELTIPSGTRRIEQYAFYNNPELKNVTNYSLSDFSKLAGIFNSNPVFTNK